MAKLNQGDVIEGIFTIALGLYIAEGSITKQKLNKIRTTIDPELFRQGRVTKIISENVLKQRKSKPPDFFNVSIEIRLKAEATAEAFGKNYEVLYKSSKDVGKIDQKIDSLISQVESSSFSKKVKKIIDTFLENNVGEIVDFIVVADGIAGEQSGGEIKGDVNLEIYARKKSSKKKIAFGSIPFSIKSESVTVASLSPYYGMLDFANALGIKWDAAEKFIRLSKPFYGPTEQKAKFKLIVSMYNELKKEIIEKSKKSNTFSKDLFNLLEVSIFGKDLADLIDVRSTGIKEITKPYFDTLKENVSLNVEVRKNNLVFLDKETKNPIFQIRTKLLKDRNEAKFYLEVGKGIYNK